MANEKQSILAKGFHLFARHQVVFWWVFVVNLILGGLGASGAARRLSGALSHSLAGQQMSKGFDLGMFLELVQQPEVRLFQAVGSSLVFAVLFLLFMLFVTGGILVAYRQDRKLTTGEFFSACGGYFWPMVRLALWSLIPFILLNFLYEGVSTLSDKIGDRATDSRTGFVMLIIGCIPVILLFVWVRMWFDLAQVKAVALEYRVMRRNAVTAFTLAGRSFAPLFWNYLGLGVLAWVITVVCLFLWAKLPPTALPVTFLFLEIIMIAHIGTRLWQKACATRWYVVNPEPMPVVAEPISIPKSDVADVPEPAPQLSVRDVDPPLSTEIEPVPPQNPENPTQS